MCDQQRLRPAYTYTKSDQSLEYSMTLRLLTEHNLEFLSLKGGITGLSDSTLVKMPMGIPLKNRNKFISPYQYIIRANKYIHDMNNIHTDICNYYDKKNTHNSRASKFTRVICMQ